MIGLGLQATAYAVGDMIGVKSRKVGETMWFGSDPNTLAENVLVRRPGSSNAWI
ncbi:hypothetical protein [Sphingomonas sp. MS122]|uniref:hypothetical protein n=1 Tax=Sphingomonas sp. MS122 TaxID=3412683 RepID=UPI003C2D33F8